MSDSTKNQHYVPEFYLRRFSSNKRITVFDKSTDVIRENQNPRNYASKRFYYDVDRKSLLDLLSQEFPDMEQVKKSPYINDPQFIESFLGRVETDISVLFNRIEQNPEIIYDNKNQIKIIIFLHLMIYRVDSYRSLVINVEQQLTDTLKKLGLTEHQIAFSKRKHGLRETPQQTQLQQMLSISSTFETAQTLLNDYEWYYGIVNCDASLITSDNPAYQLYLGFNDFCFPISNKVALIFRPKDKNALIVSRDFPVGHKIELSHRSVALYNIIQQTNANHYLFGEKDDLLFLRGFNRINKLIRNFRRSSE